MSKPYDPGLRKTEHGSKLYEIWKRIRKSPHCTEWDYFPTFYEWAMEEEYEQGAWLRRIDSNTPYGPDNCLWYITSTDAALWKAKWNETVNVIRKYYGMPPLEDEEYGD